MTERIVAIFWILVLMPACDEECGSDTNKILEIRNNSDRRIFYQIYWNYPDTLLGEFNPYTSNDYAVSPMSSQFRSLGRSCWEEFFETKEKEWVYFFSEDTLRAHTWEEIQLDYKILSRKEISLDFLRSSGWKIDYP